jgi:hypothetical protein
MDHDTRRGESKTLALASRREDEGCHRRSKAEIDGNDFGFDELYGVEDGEAGDDGSPRTVDVKVDGFGAVFFVKVEKDADE